MSDHSDNYYLAIATTATLLVWFIKAAIVFAPAPPTASFSESGRHIWQR